jgi:hypothetical protein
MCFAKRNQDGAQCPRNVELVMPDIYYVVSGCLADGCRRFGGSWFFFRVALTLTAITASTITLISLNVLTVTKINKCTSCEYDFKIFVLDEDMGLGSLFFFLM